MMRKNSHRTSSQPELDISISMPLPLSCSQTGAQAAGDSLSLEVSLQSRRTREDTPDLAREAVDIFGSAAAMASGWVPPEEEVDP